MKVSDYRLVHHAGVDFMFFEVKVNGRKTWCCANFNLRHVFVHWHEGGSRYFMIADYNKEVGDICEYLEKNLEDLPMADDYDWEQHKVSNPLEKMDIFDVEKL